MLSGSAGEEPMVCTTPRWRGVDSKFQFRAIPGGLACLRGPRSGQSRRRLKTVTNLAEPKVRIHLPPAKSRANLLTNHNRGRGRMADFSRLRERQLRAADAAAGARRALAPARRFVILGVADVRKQTV